ncbi:winged helix-turn-helix domain-containing protein [Motilimonas eburnea]|uniref:winged helix-turn-helix domain-containing protein n=1 Tax=Motilimonas eburnea TaxID=1737488 RepID=UPI001E61E36C|nr:transcriptional regulator [Motilimonas eburnea]MCE2571183.1 winged helix-turn-helix domain-containing protein [Motilimonas eburnea]
MYQVGRWQLLPNTNSIKSTDQEVRLDQKQFELLNYLASRAGEDISKNDIFDHVWAGKVVTEDVIYVAINGLRKALGDKARSPEYIKTLPGKGYRLIAEVEICSQSIKEQVKPRKILTISALFAVTFAMVIGLSLWPTPSKPELSGTQLENFQRAKYLLMQTPEHYPEAISLLQEIISIEPEFGPAYVQLASAKMHKIHQNDAELVANKTQIEAMLLRALAYDDTDKWAQQRLANLYFLLFKDHNKAKQHFELSLPDATSHYYYSQFLLALGDIAGAKDQLNAYVDLYPEAYSKETAAWIYTMSRDYPRAEQELDKISQLNQDNFYFHVSRQAIAELTGDETTAFTELHWLMQEAGYPAEDLTQVNTAFQQGGLKAAYHWLAFEDKKHLSIGQYYPPVSLARYAIGAGDYQAAIDWLKQANTEHKIELLWIAIDPKYQALHSMTEFKQLVAELGLEIKSI